MVTTLSVDIIVHLPITGPAVLSVVTLNRHSEEVESRMDEGLHCAARLNCLPFFFLPIPPSLSFLPSFSLFIPPFSLKHIRLYTQPFLALTHKEGTCSRHCSSRGSSTDSCFSGPNGETRHHFSIHYTICWLHKRETHGIGLSIEFKYTVSLDHIKGPR